MMVWRVVCEFDEWVEDSGCKRSEDGHACMVPMHEWEMSGGAADGASWVWWVWLYVGL